MHATGFHGRLLPCIARASSRQLSTSINEARRSWQVSSHGRICNPFGVISFGSVLPSGYFKVKMCEEHFFVHRVAALAFIGPPPSEGAWQVHHKDGNPGNNHISNLVYVTHSQNISHSYATGTRRCHGPIHAKPVVYRAVGSEGWTTCPSQKIAAMKLGVSQSAVSNACRHQTSLKGYEISLVDLQKPALPGEAHEAESLAGEKWVPMLCPMYGEEVHERMVSSLGRLRTRSGHIHSG